MEELDLGLFDFPSTSTAAAAPSKDDLSLLMNENRLKTQTKPIRNVNLSDLDTLENELQNLTKPTGGGGSSSNNNHDPIEKSSSSSSSSSSWFPSSLFGSSSTAASTDESIAPVSAVKASWDGFTNSGYNIHSASASTTAGNYASGEEQRKKARKKRQMIKQIEQWYKKGVIEKNPNFTEDNSYNDVEDEYESLLDERRSQESIKMSRSWFISIINGLEFGNSYFDWFDLNLDGWGEQVSEDIDSYDDIFAQLYEKYKDVQLSPEASLFLRVTMSAVILNITNKSLSTATPGFNDVIRQSPELMKLFTDATVKSLSDKSPGFAYVNNLVSQPPLPQGQQQQQQNQQRQPIPLPPYESQPPQPQYPPKQQQNQHQQQQQQQQPPATTSMRNAMNGPSSSGIESVISGLKLKTADLLPLTLPGDISIDSVSSVGSKDIVTTSIYKPQHKRKQRSDKNVVALDL